LPGIDFSRTIVEMQKITKKFGEVLANDAIDLAVHKGEVHALLGENGAGKSTLMNILYGIYRPTGGSILINNKQVQIPNPNAAIAHGIGMVHQHFMLIKPFSVTENIMLGREVVKSWGFLDRKKAFQEENPGYQRGYGPTGGNSQSTLSRRGHPDLGRAYGRFDPPGNTGFDRHHP
jgi:simple sugar transport system ATP-binding protein